MNLREIVTEVLNESEKNDNETLFILNCWRKMGARAYFNYEDFTLVEKPSEILAMRKEVLSEKTEEKPETKKKTEKKSRIGKEKPIDARVIE